jgi:dienelactone hydrolase
VRLTSLSAATGRRSIGLVRPGRLLAATLFVAAALGGGRSASGQPALPDRVSAEVPATADFSVDRLIEAVSARSDPSQTYTLYLPPGYPGERRWPALLVFDPRGRATFAARLFEEGARRGGFVIVSSFDTRSDGPWDPNLKAVAALMPELVGQGPLAPRFAIDPGRVYAAGFSGGATLASVVAAGGGIAGVIVCGGPFDPGSERLVTTAQFALAGTRDFNHWDARRADRAAEAKRLPHRFAAFDAAHAWMPAALAGEALDWLRLQASLPRPIAGSAALDDAPGAAAGEAPLALALLEADLRRARDEEARGETLAALRRFEALAREAPLLAPGALAAAEAKRLRGSEGARKALREERESEAWEDGYLHRELALALRPVVEGEPVVEEALAQAHRVDDLRALSLRPGPRQAGAARLLELIAVQLGYYLPREMRASGQAGRAATLLAVAVRAKDGPFARYNLACALARAGRRKPALEALARAVELGFADAEQMSRDEDLASLRQDRAFVRLLDELRARKTTPPDAVGRPGA